MRPGLHAALRRRPWRNGLRALPVLLLVLAAHLAFLLQIGNELEFEAPPQTVVPAELFVLPAPIALADKPSPPPPRPTRAISPAAPEPTAPAAAEPAPPSSTEPAPTAETPAEAPSAETASPAAPPAQARAAEGLDGITARLEALGAVAVDFPKSGRLVSDTVAQRGVLRIDGSTTIEWSIAGDSYRCTAEVTDVGGAVFLRQTTEGEVRASGIAPRRYTEKAFARAEVATNFQWDAGKVTFSATAAEFALVEGMQDRLSFLAQLALLAEAFPTHFAPGAAIALQVAGPRDVRVYDLRVIGWETLKTPGGSFEALKLHRAVAAGERDVRMQLWLAPALRWLPVRSLTILANGDTILTEFREARFGAAPP